MIDLNDVYKNCTLCPRVCGVDRNSVCGFCGERVELRLACASIHRGEEPPVTGSGGSGTIFVSGCNLGCVFCQNYQISQNMPAGRAVSAAEFAEICLALEGQGAVNINIVTGSHAIPAIAAGLDAARAAGLNIPALWNTSSYESAEALEMLNGRITMFLPDIKTLDSGIAAQFFHAPDYPAAATAAIMKMIQMSENAGAAPDGVVIRHLILPGFLESTRQVLRWFADNARGRALLSLMTQYTPVTNPIRAKSKSPDSKTDSCANGDDPARTPARYVNKTEYETVLAWCEEFGIEDGYCQELVTGSAWLPDFNRRNPFSSRLSKPVWHWRDGFAR